MNTSTVSINVRPVTTRRDDEVVPSTDRVTGQHGRVRLGARLGELVAEVVASHEVEECLARGSIGQHAALAARGRVPHDSDAAPPGVAFVSCHRLERRALRRR